MTLVEAKEQKRKFDGRPKIKWGKLLKKKEGC